MTDTSQVTTEKVRQPYRRKIEEDDELETQPEATSQDDPQENDEEDTQSLVSPKGEENDEEQTYKKRYGDLRTHYNRITAKHKEEIEALTEKFNDLQTNFDSYKKSSATVDVPRTEEELDQWRREYPDLYNIVRSIATREANSKAKSLEQEVETLKKQNQLSQYEKAMIQIKQAHPDFDDLRAGDEFHEWVREQEQEIQDWLYKNTTNAGLCIKAINLYKAEKGLTSKPSKKTSKVDAAMEVTPTRKSDSEGGKEKKIWTQSEIRKMNSTEYERYEAEIDKAINEGRFDPNH